jgi:tellurite resistance-related uncharacterized protein
VRRTIDGFHQDDAGEWVADLSCLHRQHVRHQPPFQDRDWVLTASGREERVGSLIDCPLCDRAQLPDGLQLARTAGPFDHDSLPAGLRREHRVAPRTWGCLRVIEGSLGFSLHTEPPLTVRLEAPAEQPIPPEVPHALTIDGPVLLAVDFLVAPDDGPAG